MEYQENLTAFFSSEASTNKPFYDGAHNKIEFKG